MCELDVSDLVSTASMSKRITPLGVVICWSKQKVVPEKINTKKFIPVFIMNRKVPGTKGTRNFGLT